MSDEIADAPAEDRARSRVSKLHVGRVYNLGNYENQRVEITVDVAEGDDPGVVLRTLEAILANLRKSSGLSSSSLNEARAAIAKPEAELSDYERERMDTYRLRLARYDAAKYLRQAARDALSTLNFTTEHTDHKIDWGEDDFEDDGARW